MFMASLPGLIDTIYAVIAGLVPAIHVFTNSKEEDVDTRHEAGHDDAGRPSTSLGGIVTGSGIISRPNDAAVAARWTAGAVQLDSIASRWSSRAFIALWRSYPGRPNEALRSARKASCSRCRARPARALSLAASRTTLVCTALISRSRLASSGLAQIAFSTARLAVAQLKLGLLLTAISAPIRSSS